MHPSLELAALQAHYHPALGQPKKVAEFTVFEAFREIVFPSVEGLSLGDRVSLFFEAVQRAIANLVSTIFGETVRAEENKPVGLPSSALVGRYGMQVRLPGITEEAALERKGVYRRIVTGAFTEPGLIYNDLVTQLLDSGLSDEDIDDICQESFRALEGEHGRTEAVATFERTLTLFLNERRYVTFLNHIHGLAPRVRMKEIKTSKDGNCFLDACSKALRYVTGGRVIASKERLRRDVAAEFDRVLSDPTKRSDREQFYRYFIGGVTGLGDVIPVLSIWEEMLQAQTPGNPYAILDWAPERLQAAIGDLLLGDTLNDPLHEATAFYSELFERRPRLKDWERQFVEWYGLDQLKRSTPERIAEAMQGVHLRECRDTRRLAQKFQENLRTHLNYTLDETERELFYRHDLPWILDARNEEALHAEMGELGVVGNLERKAENLRNRLRNITTLYQRRLQSNGTWNGLYESSLTSAVIGRAIVTLEKREGAWLFIDSLTGKEYLPTLAELANNPPLTLGRVNRGHYVTLLYSE